MSKIISAYDDAALILLKELGIYNERVVAIRLNIDASPTPTMIVERYVTEDDVTAIRKFMSKFELKETEEVKED